MKTPTHKEPKELSELLEKALDDILDQNYVDTPDKTILTDEIAQSLTALINTHYTPNEEVAGLKAQLASYKLKATEEHVKLTEIENLLAELKSKERVEVVTRYERGKEDTYSINSGEFKTKAQLKSKEK